MYPTTGLVSRWKMDEAAGATAYNALDPLLYPITFSGSPLWSTGNPASGASAIILDGIDDYGVTPTTAALRPTTALSVSLWAYSADWATISGNKGLLWHRYKNGDAYDGGYYLAAWSGSLMFYLRADDATNRTVSYALSNLTPGWHLVTGTFDGRYLKLYVDKDLVATTDIGSTGHVITYEGSDYRFSIGVTKTEIEVIDAGSYFNGMVDEVAVWNVALTDSEVVDVYANTWLALSVTENVTTTALLRYGQDYYHVVLEALTPTTEIVGDYAVSVSDGLATVDPISVVHGAEGSSVHYVYGSDLTALLSALSTTMTFTDVAEDIATITSISGGVRGQNVSLTEIASMLATLSTDSVALVLEAMLAGASVSVNGEYNVPVVQGISVKERVLITYTALLLDGVALSDSITDKVEKAALVIERLSFSATMEHRLLAAADAAVALALLDVGEGGKGAEASEGATLTASVLQRAGYYNELLVSALVTSATVMEGVLVAFVPESVVVTATPTSTALVQEALEAGITFAVNFGIGGQVYSGWVMNTKNFAVSEYQDYPFNSFCYAHGKYLGANENGIYELTGGTDAGEDIQSTLRLGVTDFNLPNRKIIDSVYLGFRADGTMLLKTIADDHTELLYEVDKTEGRLHRRRIHPMAKGLKAVYWQFELSNANGSDFELSEIEFFPVVMKRTV